MSKPLFVEITKSIEKIQIDNPELYCGPEWKKINVTINIEKIKYFYPYQGNYHEKLNPNSNYDSTQITFTDNSDLIAKINYNKLKEIIKKKLITKNGENENVETETRKT